MNARTNGGSVPQPLPQPGQSIQVNPVEAARAGLAFLQRVQFNASERAAFDAIEALLTAVAQGAVMLTQTPPQPLSVPDSDDTAPPS